MKKNKSPLAIKNIKVIAENLRDGSSRSSQCRCHCQKVGFNWLAYSDNNRDLACRGWRFRRLYLLFRVRVICTSLVWSLFESDYRDGKLQGLRDAVDIKLDIIYFAHATWPIGSEALALYASFAICSEESEQTKKLNSAFAPRSKEFLSIDLAWVQFPRPVRSWKSKILRKFLSLATTECSSRFRSFKDSLADSAWANTTTVIPSHT